MIAPDHTPLGGEEFNQSPRRIQTKSKHQKEETFNHCNNDSKRNAHALSGDAGADLRELERGERKALEDGAALVLTL